MIHTHVHTLTYIQCYNLLGEAGRQNDVLLLEHKQVKLCFKVKGGD